MTHKEDAVTKDDTTAAADLNEPDAVLDPRIQNAIGRSLKAHYDDLISTPVPDKFLLLLAQLEASEQGRK